MSLTFLLIFYCCLWTYICLPGSQKNLKFLMKEAILNYSWKQEDRKCKQNPWKETAEELIVLTCKENSCVLSGDLRTSFKYIYILLLLHSGNFFIISIHSLFTCSKQRVLLFHCSLYFLNFEVITPTVDFENVNTGWVLFLNFDLQRQHIKKVMLS